MLEGQGVLEIEGALHEVRVGSFAYVPAEATHQFRNSGSDPFRFICIVPKEGHQ
jgi:quercetin dioxygenase-like cupin family protein